MSGTFTWPQVVNGKTYAETDFRPFTYATTLPDLLGNFTAQAVNAQGAVQAANASASAAAAATSAAQAAARVAGVTTGSTANLVYPEAVANLVTAADVRDVFIYDTRLDSDGGAWRMQCHHTSWFNEALNTATRGGKRDFPAVAMIVLRPTSLTIYDMHDLDGSGVPRMWMVVPAQAGVNAMLSSLPTLNRLAAMNGRVVVASTNGIYEFNFPADAATNCTASGSFGFPGPLAQRSAAAAYVLVSAASLASSAVFDVASRVLPGSLCGRAGLSTPTWAAATGGGISVIHPDGRVASVTRTGGYRTVVFLDDARLAAGWADSGVLMQVGPLPYATTPAGSWATYFSQGSALGSGAFVVAPVGGGLISRATPGAIGHGAGLTQIAEDVGNPTTSMVSYVSPTFATGWQPGDIRLATLCDGRTGALASDIRLALDGASVAGFASVNSGVVTSTGGRIRVARNGVNDPGGAITISGLTAGETYTVDFDGYIGTAGFWQIHVESTVSLLETGFSTADAVGARFQFVANATTALLVLYAGTNTGTNYAEFDNITVRSAVADRSYRAQGLHVIGSLSRAAVATGNDVVAFSGFTASNYLQQPYNPNLDFGTGDFSLAFWVRSTTVDGSWLERSDAGYAGAGFRLFLFSGALYFDVGSVNYTSGLARLISSPLFGDSTWKQVIATRRAGFLELWVDGVFQSRVADSTNLSNASAIFRLGGHVGGSLAANTDSFSLFRISAYAPTPAQIARMFRDEAPLFDVGARVFLGGAASVVNDLSFSAHSRRLAVATPDGVSIYSGLRRVEYLSAGNLSPAMAANNTSRIALEAGALMVGTTANAGVRRDAVTGLDRMLTAPRAPFSPRRLTARGVTTDATPLTLVPRLHIGERETLIVQATIVGRVFGASDGQRIGYQRRATYYRDAGGNVTIQGSVQTIGTDTEVTSTADATLLIDTTAQTVTPQVTGVASTRIVWTATLEITRIADAQYEEIV